MRICSTAHGVPQGSILGLLFFLLYINDLPKVTSTDAKIFLCADDTSLIVINPNLEDFKINMNDIFLEINKWFKANLLSLNFKKTHCLQFTTKSCHNSNIKLSYNSKHMYNTTSTKFLGLIIDDNLSWKKHKILPLYSQYIFSLLLYIVNNKQLFISNREILNISTRSSIILHPPTSNLTKFQKGA
jgi:hypothetical protein